MAEETEKKGYGKRPLWQWVLVYLVIGAIIYGAIYYFVLSKGSGYGSGSDSPTDTQEQDSSY